MKGLLIGKVLVIAAAVCLAPLTATAQPALVIKPLAEKRVQVLPAGPLFWQVESFATLPQAQAAAGPTGLAVESAGKVWLFRLGPAGTSAAEGGKHVAQVGPVAKVDATEFLLRINEASGPSGSITPVHTHPGSEAFYVLAGEQSIRTSYGVMRVKAGQSETGHGADVPMQVSSSGATDLHALVMFVVDATKPFSSPAKFP
jgi:quercetin dioxygenase-like cupin family protein